MTDNGINSTRISIFLDNQEIVFLCYDIFNSSQEFCRCDKKITHYRILLYEPKTIPFIKIYISTTRIGYNKIVRKTE